MAKKKGKVVQMLSPENYIRQRARMLPVYECWVNTGWQENGLAHIVVSRKHTTGNLTLGIYLVDLKCLGVKDAQYLFNMPAFEYQELLDYEREYFELEAVSYILVHNIIFAGLDYAGEWGFQPHPDFLSVAQYLLEEDTDDIELLDIECGFKGVPALVRDPFMDDAKVVRIIAQLEKVAGPGNYLAIDEDFSELLDDDDAEWPETDDEKDQNSVDLTFQFKIQLKNISKPPVWRKVTVPANFTFFEFHAVIQIAFGWFNQHMFQFSPAGYHSFPQIKLKFEEDDWTNGWLDHGRQLDAEKTRLWEIFSEEKQKFSYIYDFGDDWLHAITLEKILPEQSLFPTILSGKGMCPPEDCGGPFGYGHLKEIVTRSESREYNELQKSFEGEDDELIFDPHAFNPEDHRALLATTFGPDTKK